MIITIIVEDEKYDLYYKATGFGFDSAEMEFGRLERNYNKEVASIKEAIKDDHITLEVMEQEELDNACEIIEPKDTKVFVNNLIKDLDVNIN